MMHIRKNTSIVFILSAFLKIGNKGRERVGVSEWGREGHINKHMKFVLSMNKKGRMFKINLVIQICVYGKVYKSQGTM